MCLSFYNTQLQYFEKPMPIFIVVHDTNSNYIRSKKKDKKHIKVTSLAQGELSEPDEVFLDSSSADMDFPFSLCCRRK